MKKITLVSFILLVLVSTYFFETWSPPKRISWTSGYSTLPAIAVDSANNIYSVCSDDSTGNYELYLRKSTDSGVTWYSKRLTWNSGGSVYPRIDIASDDRIHVVWHDSSPGNAEIFYKRSTDGGNSFTAVKRMTYTIYNSRFPVIAINSFKNVHLFWNKVSGSREIYHVRSTTGGVAWSSRKRLTWAGGYSNDPATAIDSSDKIFLFWSNTSPGNAEIFFKKSSNNGATWSSTKRLTYNSGISEIPTIAIDSNDNFHLFWKDSTPGNYEIYYRKSMDSGSTWSSLKRFTWNVGSSNSPYAKVDSTNHIHIVWSDSTPGVHEIYYKRSTNNGTAWSPLKRLTYNSDQSESPVITAGSDNTLHLVWAQRFSSNYELYYKNRK